MTRLFFIEIDTRQLPARPKGSLRLSLSLGFSTGSGLVLYICHEIDMKDRLVQIKPCLVVTQS